jgi:hypothetical protein
LFFQLIFFLPWFTDSVQSQRQEEEIQEKRWRRRGGAFQVFVVSCSCIVWLSFSLLSLLQRNLTFVVKTLFPWIWGLSSLLLICELCPVVIRAWFPLALHLFGHQLCSAEHRHWSQGKQFLVSLLSFSHLYFSHLCY